MDKSEYNNIPIYYCKRCLSLRIKDVPYLKDSEYCDECSSLDIGEGTIEEWSKLYEERYGYTYIDNAY